MSTVLRGRQGSKRADYKIIVTQEGMRIDVTQDFWSTEVIDGEGTTHLEANLETIIAELRAAVYYCGFYSTDGH